jgi:hypothetical protein
MEKTFLEKQIENRAIERFDNEYKLFLKFGVENNIAKRLKLSENGISIFSANSDWGLFNDYQQRNVDATKTNYAQVRQIVIEQYIKEETDILLKKMDALQYFFNSVINNE